MNKLVKELWINKLESGEYAQANGELRTPHGYCCWGVLCDAHAQTTGNKWEETYDNMIDVYGDDPRTIYTYMGSQYYIPEEVAKWAGIPIVYSEASGVIMGPRVIEKGNEKYEAEGTLADLNDSGYNFKAIAKIIREKL